MRTHRNLARGLLLMGSISLAGACALGEDAEPGTGFDLPDAALVLTSDAGVLPDASGASQDASVPTPRPDAGADSGAVGAVMGSDAGPPDAGQPDAAHPDGGALMPDAGPDSAIDAGPSADAQTDAGDLGGVCTGGKVGTDSTKQAATNMFGSVELWVPPTNAVTRFQTLMLVPAEPTTRGTLFLWPGLQPLRGPDPARIGNGVLQPVLTWGSSCAPKKPASYNDWWISGMYVNVSTSAAGPTGCAGGDAMNVAVGDDLVIDFRVEGTRWTQTVLNQQNGKQVDFTWDLKGQAQNRVLWDIEEVSSTKPTEDVIFLDSVVTFASPATTCQPNLRGPTDYYSAPVLSSDGLHCCFGKIVLRSRGVAATTPDQP